MKFPTKNSKSQSNQQNGKKVTNGKTGLNKGVKNQRNLIQQQRANTLQSINKGMNKKRVNNVEEVDNEYAVENNFDDEVEGMDANVHINRNKNDSKGGKRENKQYNDLMQESGKGFRREKNKYFLQSEKYQGRKVHEQEDDQAQEMDIDEQDNFDDGEDESNFDENEAMIDEEQSQDQEEDQQQEDDKQEEQQQQNDDNSQQQNNEIHQALNELQKKRHSTSKLIQSQLESINLEDKKDISQVIKSKNKSTQQEYEEALGLKKLLEIYDKLVEVRYGQQRELQEIKKYPKMNQQDDIPSYPPMSHQLFTLSRELQDEVITNLSQSLKIYKNLAQNTLSSTSNQKDSDNSDQQKMNEQTATDDLEQMVMSERENLDNQDDAFNPGRLNVDKIYNLVKSTISKETALVEKELIKWSQKTSFLSSSSSTQLNSLLMQTPVGQAKKVLSNWERMANKCQQKRGQQLFKILFESEDNIHSMTDAQIYDDYDLFIELEKYYLEKVNDQNEDNEFLSSATMKYLKNKQANQLNHERKQKDVDRKASKNRKIRYGVHTKLLNFMPAVQENVIETRDEIVKNMFNCNAKVNEQAGEGNTYRVRGELLEEELIDVE